MVSGDRRDAPEDYENIDFSEWRRGREPVVSEFRRQHGDLQFTKDCSGCNGRGKRENPNGLGVIPCDGCKGRGRIHEAEDIRLKEIRYAQVQVKNVMNWLWERGTLDDQHLHDGQTFEQWQMVQQARLGLRIKVRASGEATDGEDLRERGFTLLLMRIPVRYQRWINEAVHEQATNHARFIAQKNCRFYREAFDCLSGRLPPILEELKALRDAKAKAGE